MSHLPFIEPETWPPEWRGVLADAALRGAAGASVFERGRAYMEDGAVEVLGEDPLPEPALRAQVAGSELYGTEVWIEGDALAGQCDCPHAAEGHFCKHQVALALVWSAHREGRSIPTAGRRARRGRAQGEDDEAALRDFLCRQPVAVLADKLLDMAELDPALEQRLQRWREVSEAGPDTRNLKRLIDELLPDDGGFMDWDDDVGLAGMEEVPALLRQARAHDPDSAIGLCEHALRRAWKLQQDFDDEDGTVSELCEDIGQEWLACLRAAGPRPAAFGEAYLQLLLDDEIGSFDSDAAEAAMGAAALQRFRQVLAQHWRRAKDADRAASLHRRTRPPGSAGSDMDRRLAASAAVPSWGLMQLERLHLEQLERVGDLDAALAVMREDLSQPRACVRLIEFLQAHGRHGEALAEAQRAYEAFPGDWSVQSLLIRCCEQAGRTAQALALRRRQFDERPGVDTYQQVLKAADAAQQGVPALRGQLLEALEAREQMDADQAAQAKASPYRLAPPGVRDVTLRADILASEGRWSEACQMVQPPAWCADRVLRNIALHLGAEQRGDAVRMLLRVLADAMAHASSPYAQELALVGEIARRMDAAPRAVWLAELHARYKLKRNFIKGLPRP